MDLCGGENVVVVVVRIGGCVFFVLVLEGRGSG